MGVAPFFLGAKALPVIYKDVMYAGFAGRKNRYNPLTQDNLAKKIIGLFDMGF